MASAPRLLLLTAIAALALALPGASTALAGAPAEHHQRHGTHDRGTHGHKGKRTRIENRLVMRKAVSSRTGSAPTRIAITDPEDGQTVAGVIVWRAAVSGPQPSRVAFKVDGSVERVQRSSLYAFGGDGRLDTTSLGNGPHRLTVIARIRGHRNPGATVTVTVSNPLATRPPSPVPVTKKPPPAPRQPAPAPQQPAPTPTPEVPAPAPEAPAPAPEGPAPAPEEPAPEEEATAPEPEPEPNPTPGGRVYWGAWIGKQLTGDQPPWEMGAAAKFEQMTGKKLSIINFSAPFANCPTSGGSCSYYNFPTGEMDTIRSHGSIPMYSWASQSIPSTRNEPDFQLGDVIAGNFDSYIRRFAEAARGWGHPFFLRFNWEMNGAWFPWGEGANGNRPGEYVAAWRHVHDIFAEVGATNVSWVWCPNVDPENSLQNLAGLYPGDDYVDWTGLDGYNWGTNPAKPDRWRSFDQLYKSTYHSITDTIAPSKPLVISEMGTTEYGGSKAAWLSDALAKIPTDYPKIRGMLYFEQYDDGMDWPLETSQSAEAAFAEGIENPAYAGNEFAGLAANRIQPLS